MSEMPGAAEYASAAVTANFTFTVDACLGVYDIAVLEACNADWLGFEQQMRECIESYGREKFLGHYLACLSAYRGAATASAHLTSELETAATLTTRPLRSNVVPLLKTFHSWVVATILAWRQTTTLLSSQWVPPCPAPSLSKQLPTLLANAVEQLRGDEDFPELPIHVLASTPTPLDDLFAPAASPTRERAAETGPPAVIGPTQDLGHAPAGVPTGSLAEPMDAEQARAIQWCRNSLPEDRIAQRAGRFATAPHRKPTHAL